MGLLSEERDEQVSIDIELGDLIIKYDAKGSYLIGIYPVGFCSGELKNYHVLVTKDKNFRDSLFGFLGHSDKTINQPQFTQNENLRIYEYNMTDDSPIQSGLTPTIDGGIHNV